jgi:hypothetical protein
MNDCCVIPGHARIVESTKPGIAWRVVCVFCGLTIHQQEVE